MMLDKMKLLNNNSNLTWYCIAGAYRLETLNEKAEPANAIWNLRQYQDGAFVDVVTQDLEDPDMFTVHNDIVR